MLNANSSMGADRMFGGRGNDTYHVSLGSQVVSEGANAGIDTVKTVLTSYTLGANVENLTLTRNGNAAGRGNDLANAMHGNDHYNPLYGAGGNDKLYGHGGDDRPFGEAGNDTLDGGQGADRMFGGSGNDIYFATTADACLEATGGYDHVYSNAKLMTLSDNVEALTLVVGAGGLSSGHGNDGANTLSGNVYDNSLWGGGGNDTLFGNTGDDLVSGGAGADQVLGSAGNDRLFGGTGIDQLGGGTGLDRFVFAESGAAHADVIGDFVHADDTLVLSNALDLGLPGGNGAGLLGLVFVGSAAGSLLSDTSFHRGLNETGMAAGAASGIYVNTGDGRVWYNPTSDGVGDSLLLCRVSVAVAATMDASDFAYLI